MAKPGYVTVRLPKDKNEPTVFVGLNGKGYTIQRGKDVEVPAGVAEILRNSMEADDMADKYKESVNRDGNG